MVHILSAYGIPPKIVAAIVAVATPDGEIRFFEILAGVLQGDTLAPFLFTVVLDYAMRQALDGREENMGLCLAALITNTDVDRL